MSNDSIVYQNSIVEPEYSMYFKKASWLMQTDNNNGIYSSNQINWDLTSLSNSSLFLNWASGYATIPVVINITRTNLNSANPPALDAVKTVVAGLKNGYWNILRSIEVKIGGRSIVIPQEYLNEYVSYRFMTETSQDELQQYGDILGFSPDSPFSAKFTNTFGVQNNSATSALPNPLENATYVGDSLNAGLNRRLKNIKTTSNQLGNLLPTASDFKNQGQSYLEALTADTSKIFVMCVLRLRDLHDLFSKMPLVKGCYFQINANLNQGSFKYTDATKAISWNGSGTTNPVQFNQDVIGGANADFTVSIGDSTGFRNCSIYVKGYDLMADKKLEYEKSLGGSMITVRYNDIVGLPETRAIATGQFESNKLLSGSITNPKRLIIIPYVSAGANGATTVRSLLSPYWSGGADPICLRDIEVRLGGEQVWNLRNDYDFQQFFENVYAGLNAGQSSITTGLLDYATWSVHRYVVCDLTNRPQETMNQPLSLNITYKNVSQVAMDALYFCEVEKELKLDIITGTVQ